MTSHLPIPVSGPSRHGRSSGVTCQPLAPRAWKCSSRLGARAAVSCRPPLPRGQGSLWTRVTVRTGRSPALSVMATLSADRLARKLRTLGLRHRPSDTGSAWPSDPLSPATHQINTRLRKGDQYRASTSVPRCPRWTQSAAARARGLRGRGWQGRPQGQLRPGGI